MPAHRQLQLSNTDEPLPKPFTYRMGARDNFIPVNMREGKPERLIRSAITLSKWARNSVQDIDTFLAFESAFCLIADDLDDFNCPHNTIVKIFYTGFRKNELKQFRWFLRGFPFPRKFSHPLAIEERHGAAMATFPDIIEDEIDLRRYLIFSGADEVGMKIGIDFLDLPARRIQFHDIDDYVTEIPYHSNNQDEEVPRYSPSLRYPTPPRLQIHQKLPKREPRSPDIRQQSIPPSVLNILNAINVHRAINNMGETSNHAYIPPSTSTHPTIPHDHHMNDDDTDIPYGGPTTDPLHPDVYDW
jgi:hypothetical protein